MNLSDLAKSSASYSASTGSIPDTSSAIAQGNALLDQATDASPTVYAGAAAAAQAIVSALPAGSVTTVAQDAVHIAEAAASGAAAGASIGVYFGGVGAALGTEVGAAIGFYVGCAEDFLPLVERDHWNPIDIAGDLVVDVFNVFGLDEDDPAQTEYRYSADRICFPSAALTYPYGVIPGFMRWNSRGGAASTFYQVTVSATDAPYVAASRAFTFSVAWFPIPKSTDTTRYNGWHLAQAYLFNDAVTRSLYNHPWNATTSAQLGNELVSVMGGSEAKAAAALARIARWYGDPTKFSTSRPYASTGGNPPDIANTEANVQATIKVFDAHPLDFLYYPIPSYYNHAIQEFQETSKGGETDVMMSADTLLLGLCELAAMGASDAEAFHYVLFLAYTWKRARKADARDFPGLSAAMHPNFARVIGLIAAVMKAEAKKTAAAKASKAKAKSASKVTAPTARPRVVDYSAYPAALAAKAQKPAMPTRVAPPSSASAGGGTVRDLLALGGAAAVGLMLFLVKKRRM
jgi:hypothetical protein